MFGQKKGGIEQAFVDYSVALALQGNEVLSVTHPNAAIISLLYHHHIRPVAIKNYGQWDLLAVCRLRKILHIFQPDVIVTHGNRATILLKKASAGKFPVAAVCHNYSLKHVLGCNALLTITDHLRETVIAKGQPENTVFTIPNMISLPSIIPKRPAWRSPPIIGAMGRFVSKKGFDIFIKALALLKEENIPFQAVLGGGGEEETRLRELARSTALGEQLIFSGWVEDKEEFYQQCDIFCLPSLHEPFGIVLLEALLHRLPVVTTKSEGPREIVQHQKDALMVPVGDVAALALALKILLSSEEEALALGEAGYQAVTSRYNNAVVGKTLHQALEKIS